MECMNAHVRALPEDSAHVSAALHELIQVLLRSDIMNLPNTPSTVII